MARMSALRAGLAAGPSRARSLAACRRSSSFWSAASRRIIVWIFSSSSSARAGAASTGHRARHHSSRFMVAQVAEHSGDDEPPPLNLAFLAGPQIVSKVELLLGAEGGREAPPDVVASEPAAEARADQGVGIPGGRVGVNQRPHRVEEDG